MKNLLKALAAPLLKRVAVAIVTHVIDARQAKLNPKDREDQVQIEILEYAKHQIANL